MRRPKKLKFALPERDLKLVDAVSPGIAIRTKTWTGFGAGVGLLGYDDDDSRDSKGANTPNLESVGFVPSVVENEGEGDGEDEEGAE